MTKKKMKSPKKPRNKKKIGNLRSIMFLQNINMFQLLNNIYGKIVSLIGEMKELNSNKSNIIRLLTRKYFPEESESLGFKSEIGSKK